MGGYKKQNCVNNRIMRKMKSEVNRFFLYEVLGHFGPTFINQFIGLQVKLIIEYYIFLHLKPLGKDLCAYWILL